MHSPILVCSIGNPSALYANTLHSAGHVAIKAILPTVKFNQAWRPHLNGEISEPGKAEKLGFMGKKTVPNEYDHTFWQCGSFMNVSGPAVKKVWERWRGGSIARKETGKLIILHDEMEREFGKFGLKTDGRSSARGHNGIKSIQASFANTPFMRIGFGIGRPVSRDPNTVSKYVLRKMTASEKNKIEEAAREASAVLKDIEHGYI